MKLGKDESTESADDSETTSKEETPKPSGKSDESESTEKKKDVDRLRKVIKVDQKEDSNKEEKKEGISAPEKKDDESTEKPKEKTEKTEIKAKTDDKPSEAPAKTETATKAAPDANREDLEQKRNMLQNMKDFDFQIKKNQEDISNISEKIDALTKDLDDLVSLYEIVSEQMNPFVGLSKVTKKRIDALENFTKEIEDVKARMGDVESTLEKGIGGIQRMAKKFDGKEPARGHDQKIEKELSELEKSSGETEGKSDETTEESEKTTGETATEPESKVEKISKAPEELANKTVSKPEPESEQSSVKTEITPSKMISTPTSQFVSGELSDDELDKILSASLESMLAEQNIENMINEFLLSLK